MHTIRTYGQAPFRVAVIHGGPGAPGEMAPVARELARQRGVLEPLQTATSLEGQVRELRMALEHHGDPPVTLVGFSWGAMLSFLVAGCYPTLVNKLILVGSAVFDAQYAPQIMETRLGRLRADERREAEAALMTLRAPTGPATGPALARLGALLTAADAYDPLPDAHEVVEVQGDVFQQVWPAAEELRASGKLLELGRQMACPVVALHGDYDPHPAAGIRIPLGRVLHDFRFVTLEHCGHRPWIERHARESFFQFLEGEL